METNFKKKFVKELSEGLIKKETIEVLLEEWDENTVSSRNFVCTRLASIGIEVERGKEIDIEEGQLITTFLTKEEFLTWIEQRFPGFRSYPFAAEGILD